MAWESSHCIVFVFPVPLTFLINSINLQLHKLETKLAFFNDMENVAMRVREHLVYSWQKLYHKHSLIIASRLGLPASSFRGLPSSLPINRIPVNFGNSSLELNS